MDNYIQRFDDPIEFYNFLIYGIVILFGLEIGILVVF